MYINVARINNRASTRQVDCPASLDTYSLPRSLNSTKHGQATLYLRSCIIVLINFIIIIFEIYVHKKLIYFVRREGEIEIGRERERVCEREMAGKTGKWSSELYTCVRMWNMIWSICWRKLTPRRWKNLTLRFATRYLDVKIYFDLRRVHRIARLFQWGVKRRDGDVRKRRRLRKRRRRVGPRCSR